VFGSAPDLEQRPDRAERAAMRGDADDRFFFVARPGERGFAGCADQRLGFRELPLSLGA
jgi:hypothetical protein